MKNSKKQQPQLLIFSANTQCSLKELFNSYQEYNKLHPEALVDLAYTLARRREKLPYRSYFVQSGIDSIACKYFRVPSCLSRPISGIGRHVLRIRCSRNMRCNSALT